MGRRWTGWLVIWILGTGLISGLAPVAPPGAEAQPSALPAGWLTYTDPDFGYTIAYPPGWQAQVVFENPRGKPYLIRHRLAFHDPAGHAVEIDVWDKDPALPLDRWLAEVEGITIPVEGTTGPVQPNAVLAGQQAWVLVQPGGCGVRPLVIAYVPFGDQIFKIHLPVVGGPASLATYEAMLRSFTLSGVDPARAQPAILPDLQPLLPSACDTNLCPSTCWGLCTFAATNEGCCGYHAVPRWQCSKECVGDQPGEFLGNCVWWGAYTRRDVGALASGNAENWAISVRNTGQLPVDKKPKVGDIVVHPGSSYNHVAYVVWVSPDRQSYKMSDMGWCSDCGPDIEETKLRTVDEDDEFIHCQGDPPIPTVDWRFTNCPFGWAPSQGFAASSLNGTTWRLDPASDPAGAPVLLSPLLSVPAGDYDQVRVQMSNHALETAGKIYFTTAISPTFGESRAVGFTTSNDGLSREVTVAMAGHPQWQGTITRLALYPVLAGNSDGSDDWVEVDRFRLANETPVTPIAYVYLPLVVRVEPPPNQPPYPPSEPSPADGATDLPATLTLSWSGGDPDGDAVTYDVYLDPAAGPLESLVCSGTLTTTCDPGPLSENTPYAWRVLATDDHSATTAGPVWEFTTVLTNQLPYSPSEPSPADGATDLPATLTLSWSGGDPDGDAVTYDVYLDPAAGPLESLVCSGTLTTTCDPGPLSENTPYAWRVLATDEHSATTGGPVWGFMTVLTGCVDLIANGGYESDSGWEIPSTAYPAAYSEVQAHSGSRSMQTGIVDPADNVYSYSSIRQLVTIPDGAASATLRTWLYPLSEETTASEPPPQEALMAGDAQYVLVLNSANQWLERLFWQRRDDPDWIFFEADLLDYAGQTIKLQFGTLNDGAAGVTAMYVDDVSVEVCSPPVPPAP